MAQTREIEKRRETRRSAVCLECLPRNSLIGPAHKASWHMRPPKGHVAMLSLVHVSFYLSLISFGQKFCRKMLHKRRKKKSEKFLYFLILGKLIGEFLMKSSKFKILTSKENTILQGKINLYTLIRKGVCKNSFQFWRYAQSFLMR